MSADPDRLLARPADIKGFDDYQRRKRRARMTPAEVEQDIRACEEASRLIPDLLARLRRDSG